MAPDCWGRLVRFYNAFCMALVCWGRLVEFDIDNLDMDNRLDSLVDMGTTVCFHHIRVSTFQDKENRQERTPRRSHCTNR